ncbi:MAG: hypothetical protein CL775_01175 [Chloroflexi bacterium]|nr:hypothetical protein [Chloroflexota bacterium]|tara:strand:- start:298 stop:966 length:669 start_codon:yes stop_codon:yes gene_type:complete
MNLFENENYKIEYFVSGFLSNNSYLISSKKSEHATIIDVPENPRDLLSKIQRNKMDKSLNQEKIKVIITHGHYDHIEGLDLFLDRIGKINITIGLKDSRYIANNENLFPIRKDDSIINGDITVKSLITPGHTEGSICLLFEPDDDSKFLFTGDTLFPGGPGKTSSSIDFENIYNSINNKIYTLPGETKILPGHGKFTDIRQSKREFKNFNLKSHIFGDVTWE